MLNALATFVLEVRSRAAHAFPIRWPVACRLKQPWRNKPWRSKPWRSKPWRSVQRRWFVAALGVLVSSGVALAQVDWIGTDAGLAPAGSGGDERSIDGKAVGRLADALPGYAVARCMFARGRLVLKKNEQFLVLRQGDQIPDSEGLEVVEISKTRAVLASRWSIARQGGLDANGIADVSAMSVPVPRQLILIEMNAEGVPLVTVGTPIAPIAPAVLVQEPSEVITIPFDPPSGGRPVGAIDGLGTITSPSAEESGAHLLPVTNDEGQHP